MSSETAVRDRTDGGDAQRWSRPWQRWPVALLWWALFAAAILASFESVWLFQRGPNPNLQLGIRETLAGVVPFSPKARAAGLRPGDQIVSLDGAAPDALAPLRPTGDSTVLEVRGTDGAVTSHRLTRSQANVDLFYAGSGISQRDEGRLLALACAFGDGVLILAALLLFRRGRFKLMPTLLSFAFLAIGLCMLNGPAAQVFGMATWRIRMLIIGWTLFILAILLFPGGRFAWRWQRWLAWPLSVATVGLMFAPPSVWPLWSAIHTFLLVVTAGSLVFRYRGLPAGPERQQVRWALFGFVAGAVALIPAMYLDLVVAPSDSATRVIIWAGLAEEALIVLTLSLIAGGLLVSLVKYRLYDADAVISRSVSIGALTLALLAVFAGTEKVIELLGEEWFGEDLGVLAGGLGAGLAAVMIVPLHHRLSHWAEHRFRKDLIRLRQGLPLLVGDMRETAPARRIAAATLDSVMRGVRASRAAVVIEGELAAARGIEPDAFAEWNRGWRPAAADGLDADRADPLFPLRVPLEADGHGRIGWLLLGPRPDGSFYGKDERETLAEIADPVARALEIAAAREKREEEQRAINLALLRASEESIRVFGEVSRKLDRLLAPPGVAAE